MSDENNADNHTIILGAGPAGLAAAHRLLSKTKQKVTIIDRAQWVGGAGASFQWKGHTLDYGPHAFHTRGDEPEKLVRSLFKDHPEELLEGRKLVHVYLKKRFFKYPLQIREVALKFNPLLSFKIGMEFILSSLFHALVSIPVENFENWGKKRFGPTLYKISFGDYTEKVWKTKATRISEKFASEKIQGFSFVNLIVKLLRIGGQVTEPYYQTWIYPKHGAGTIYKKMAQEIESMGGKIILGAEIKSIANDGDRISSVEYQLGSKTETLPCSQMITTALLPQFVRLLANKLPFIVRNRSDKLKYISLILVYLEFDAEKISDDHWFYLLDPHFKFNRVTEQKNLSAFTMEKGKSVLSFELTCRKDDELWKMTDAELFELAKEDCKYIHLLKKVKITDYHIKRVPNVYEVYLKNFDDHAQITIDYLREFSNLVTIGRRGLFLQGDMHQAVEMGIDIADRIIQAKGLSREVSDAFYKKYVKYVEFN